MNLPAFFRDREILHRCLLVVWVLLIPPTLLWWSESILWVLLISIYANIVGHWSAAEASKAAKEAVKS